MRAGRTLVVSGPMAVLTSPFVVKRYSHTGSCTNLCLETHSKAKSCFGTLVITRYAVTQRILSPVLTKKTWMT